MLLWVEKPEDQWYWRPGSRRVEELLMVEQRSGRQREEEEAHHHHPDSVEAPDA